MRHLLATLLFFASSGPAFAQTVHVVDPATATSQISTAAAVAVAGDVILVKTGTYGPFQLTAGVVVIADDGANVTVDATATAPAATIVGLPAGEVAALHGLELNGFGNQGALFAQNCDGYLWCEDVSTTGGVWLLNVARTLFNRSVLAGRSVTSGTPAPALRNESTLADSRLALFDCDLTGGSNASGDAAPGCFWLGFNVHTFFASGCRFVGGAAMLGAGGEGLLGSGGGLEMDAVDCLFLGGSGTPAGVPSSNVTVDADPRLDRTLEIDAPVRENQPPGAMLAYTGVPDNGMGTAGDLVWFYSVAAPKLDYVPAYNSIDVAFAPPQVLGPEATDTNGDIALPVGFGSNTTASALVLFVQTLVVENQAPSFTISLGAPSMVVVLDELIP